MWILNSQYGSSEFYTSLEKDLLTLVKGEKNIIANLANISSWIFHSIPDLNWSGFYLWDEGDRELVLGPFQGKPACIRIRLDRGVCGAAFSQRKTFRIDDVNSFPGHIACDQASLSELVIPLIKNDKVWALLDLDSPLQSRFSEEDEKMLTKIMNILGPQLF